MRADVVVTAFCLFGQDIDLHDAAHFRLSRTEATALDPQARLLLEVAAEVGIRVPAGSTGINTTNKSRGCKPGLVAVLRVTGICLAVVPLARRHLCLQPSHTAQCAVAAYMTRARCSSLDPKNVGRDVSLSFAIGLLIPSQNHLCQSCIPSRLQCICYALPLPSRPNSRLGHSTVLAAIDRVARVWISAAGESTSRWLAEQMSSSGGGGLSILLLACGMSLHCGPLRHLGRQRTSSGLSTAIPCYAQALAEGAPLWGSTAARRTGTYVGCMFTDYMPLLRQGYGLHHTGAVMTGYKHISETLREQLVPARTCRCLSACYKDVLASRGRSLVILNQAAACSPVAAPGLLDLAMVPCNGTAGHAAPQLPKPESQTRAAVRALCQAADQAQRHPPC